MNKEEEYKNIVEILNDSIVIEDGTDDTLGKDLQEIAKEVTNDRNVYRFGNMGSDIVFEDALMGAIGDIPSFDSKIPKRYQFMSSFRYHYNIGLAAKKSGLIEKYVGLASSLMGFRALMDVREAGTNEKDNSKLGIVDRIKKG